MEVPFVNKWALSPGLIQDTLNTVCSSTSCFIQPEEVKANKLSYFTRHRQDKPGDSPDEMRMRYMSLSNGTDPKLRARVGFCRPEPNNNKFY